MKLRVIIGSTGQDCLVETEDGEPVEGIRAFDVSSSVGKATIIKLEILACKAIIHLKSGKEGKEAGVE